jgi:hypothetical protein
MLSWEIKGRLRRASGAFYSHDCMRRGLGFAKQREIGRRGSIGLERGSGRKKKVPDTRARKVRESGGVAAYPFGKRPGWAVDRFGSWAEWLPGGPFIIFRFLFSFLFF